MYTWVCNVNKELAKWMSQRDVAPSAPFIQLWKFNEFVRSVIHWFIRTISRTFFRSKALINLHRQHHLSHNNSQLNTLKSISWFICSSARCAVPLTTFKFPFSSSFQSVPRIKVNKKCLSQREEFQCFEWRFYTTENIAKNRTEQNTKKLRIYWNWNVRIERSAENGWCIFQ